MNEPPVMKYFLAILTGIVFLFCVFVLANASETATEWYFRTVPTSVPAYRCSNGRTAHIKYPVDTWKHCRKDEQSTYTAIDFVSHQTDHPKSGLVFTESFFEGKLFDFHALGPSPKTPQCRGHWRVPRVWCPGPMGDQ